MGTEGSSASPERKCYVCTHAFQRLRPVLYVTRPDGDWCFLCGDEHPDQAAFYRVVGMGHVLTEDPALAEVFDLAPSEEAERASVTSVWKRSQF